MRALFFISLFLVTLFAKDIYIKTDKNTPLPNATVICGNKSYVSDANGTISINQECKPVLKTYGFRGKSDDQGNIVATPFVPKGVFVSFYGITSSSIMGDIYELIDRGVINTLVLEIKSDDGLIAFDNNITLAQTSGANSVLPIKDINRLLQKLKEKNIYTVAKVALFKDGKLPIAEPSLAIKRKDGSLFRDKQKVTWSDPFSKKVRDYNLEVIKLALDVGFDEVMLDYVRFPDHNNLVYAKESNTSSRVETINSFIKESKALSDMTPTFLSAAIFGYTAWNEGDAGIGQDIESIGENLDYIAPMLYPSGFSHGIPNFRNPMNAPYEIVAKSIEKSKERSGIDGARFRPWLQSFKDYAFDRRHFGIDEINRQIKASNDTGCGGWYMWNARNIYTTLKELKKSDKVALK